MSRYRVIFSDTDYQDYLEHHGILGQKWGHRHGPPYPLDKQESKRIRQSKRDKARAKRQKRYKEIKSKIEASRKKRILKDPNKMIKHINELSQEEIDKKLLEWQNAKRIREASGRYGMKFKGKKKKYANSLKTLTKHRDKFTDEEYKYALEQLDMKHRIHQMKQQSLNDKLSYIFIATNFVNTLLGTGSKFYKFKQDRIKAYEKTEDWNERMHPYKSRSKDARREKAVAKVDAKKEIKLAKIEADKQINKAKISSGVAEALKDMGVNNSSIDKSAINMYVDGVLDKNVYDWDQLFTNGHGWSDTDLSTYQATDRAIDFLEHYGIKGQKWGVRRSQAELGYRNNHHSKTDRNGDNERTVFISGSVKTQNKKSGYYIKELPKALKDKIITEVNNGSRILVGDAPGIDTQVQNLLAKLKYNKVDIYTADPEARMNADKNGELGWNIKKIDSSRYDDPESAEARATKDKAMTARANAGIAVVIPDGARATRNNVQRLIEANKEVNVFQIGDEDFMDLEEFKKNIQHSNLIMHHGIKGQQWGVRNGPPYPLKRYSTRVYKNNKQRMNEIYKSMNRRDQTLLYPDSKPNDPFWKGDEYTPKSIAYSCVQSIKGKPVAFIVVGNAGNGEGEVGIGTRGDVRHQGSGYTLGSKMVNWFNNQDNIRTIYWQPWHENTASIKLAEKLGFQKTNVNHDGWLEYKLEKEKNNE